MNTLFFLYGLKIRNPDTDLVISLLNALLPLKQGEEITEIEYLPIETILNFTFCCSRNCRNT